MSHPIALIAYNRPKHLKRVLKALRKLQAEPLYVFADGPKPKKNGDHRKIEAVRVLL